MVTLIKDEVVEMIRFLFQIIQLVVVRMWRMQDIERRQDLIL